MSITPPALPASYSWGFVVGQVIHAIADTAADVDRLPQARAATGTIRFEPLETLRKVTAEPAAFVAHEVVTATLGTTGELVDAEGQVGIWLVTGDYRVSFAITGAAIPGFNVTVTDAHTLVAPLDLVTVAPYTPPSGTTVTTMLVPAGPAEGQVLGWASGALTWVDAGAGGGAYPVQRHTLTANWAVSTAGWPTDIPVTLVLTQDGTGGHTVTHDAEALDVDNTPGGETVTAWVWTGTAWRWFSDAAPASVVIDETPPTAGTLQLAPSATEIVATSVAAMDETALHPQPYRFAVATTAASSGWLDAQWEAAMGAWQASATATLAGLTMGTAYSARCQVRDMAGNTRMTAVVNATTTVAEEPVTLYEATFTAPDGTLLSDYTPDVGGPGTINADSMIYGNALWSVPGSALNSELNDWHAQPALTITTAAQKFVRWTYDYDYTPGENYSSVWIELSTYNGFGLGRLQGVLSGGTHAGTMVSSEVSPTAPTIPQSGRAILEFEGTPGVSSNWTNRFYIVVDDEPVLHTTEVITRNIAANTHKFTVGSSMNGGVLGAQGTKLLGIKLEGVPA